MLNKFKKAFVLLKGAIHNFFSKSKVVFIVEDSDWVIWKEGFCLSEALHKFIVSEVTSTHYGKRNSIVHFASINSFIRKNRIKSVHPSNRVFVTWYHFETSDKRISLIPKIIKGCEKIHTSCQITKRLLMEHGVPEQKIFIAPIPIDLKVFNPASYGSKNALRKKHGIPDNAFVVGSFQKDGVGWGDGLEPKLIKGPDIFCDVVIELSKRYPLHVLLTGPSRGYVKKRLTDAKVPFSHFYLKNPDDVAELYKCLDLYLMTSRAEGGPKSMTESWAMEVPYVGTKVGMVSDYGKDYQNSLICEHTDQAGLIQRIESLVRDTHLASNLIAEAKKDVVNLTYDVVIDRYRKEFETDRRIN